MPNPNQITGRVEIFIDGQYYPSIDIAKLNPGGVDRPAVVGDRVHGFMEKTVAPEVEATFAHTPVISLDTIGAVVNSTLIFQSDNGVTFTLQNAWCSEVPKLTGDGKITAKFSAMSCDED